jgi:hypothetical protein
MMLRANWGMHFIWPSGADPKSYPLFFCTDILMSADVEKVETALLEKIGRDLLKERQTKPDHEADLFRLKQLRISAGIIPRPNVKHYAECPEPLVVTGLRVNLREVTYAAVDVSSGVRLVGWGALPLFENVNSPVHYHHHALDKTARIIGEAQFILFSSIFS